MNLTLDQLSALDSIARTGSFAAAAAELHRVPSAVSYAVKGLEDALGVPVFDRTGRKAVLTREGARILEQARAVLDEARALERLAAELRGGWEAELRVVVDGALPLRGVSLALARFAAPDVPTRLRVDVEYREGVLHRFDTEEADLALILGFEGNGDQEGYEARPLPPLELWLVVAADHPLATGPSSPETRASHAELVVRDSSPALAQQPRRSFLGSAVVAHLSDFHTKRMALLDGAGFGWVPRHLVESDVAAGTLVFLPGEGARTFTYHPQLVHRSGRTLGRGAALFLRTVLGA